MTDKVEEIRLLAKVTEQINAGLTLTEVLDNIFSSFRPLIPYNRIGFALLDEGGKSVRSHWARSDASEIKIPVGYSARLEGSSLQEIIQTGRPRILNDLENYLREHPDSVSTQKIVEEGMRSSLTCPLTAKGKPIGFVFFSSMERETYKDAHVEIFLEIAGHVAMIVEKGRLYQQLEEYNNLKNKFLGIAAHDLRSPIGVLKGYTGLFLQGILGEVPESQRQFLVKMERVCENMLNLVNDLLDISAIEAGQLDLAIDAVDLSAFLQECQETNALLAKAKSMELTMEVEEGLSNIVMDPRRITQVLNNLLGNAIKFSHPGTTITLTAKRSGDMVEIAVRDQGQGIPKKELPKLFSEFAITSVRPTAGEKSTGLGLAIVKRIVEAHGGRIWMESTVNVGSTFTCTLPVKGPPPSLDLL